MLKPLVTIAMCFSLTSCGTTSMTPSDESAEALVAKGCQSAGADFDQTVSSYFFKASQINEKYRELSRAYINLTSLMKTVQNEEVALSTRKSLAYLAQNELSIVRSFCGPSN